MVLVPAVTVVRVISVSSDVVVAPVLCIVGARTERAVNDGIGPSTETRLNPPLPLSEDEGIE